MRTIIISLESGQELVYELAWTPVADQVWDLLVKLSYVCGLGIDHQWRIEDTQQSVSGLCLTQTHDVEPTPILDHQRCYWSYQPRPGDICLDPLTGGRDLRSAWLLDRPYLVAQRQLTYPQMITGNLLVYWRVHSYRSNNGQRRLIWQWLNHHRLADRIDWSQPQWHCHGRALVAYLRDHSQLQSLSQTDRIAALRVQV